MPFLSLLDDRAKPKGSRDPLGFELVWTHFGRKVIGNLTTITSSIDNFAVALLGFRLANESVSSNIGKFDRHKNIREMFLRYEQLTGYIRCCGQAKDIMGITRIKHRLHNDTKITLGQSTEQQILSDQASYGLWGLYSSAARESGLISGNDRVLTEKGKLITDEIIKQLGPSYNEIQALLGSDRSLSRDDFKSLAKPLINALRHTRVKGPLLEALMAGQNSGDIQSELWIITQRIFKQSGQAPKSYMEFINEIPEHNPSKKLVKCINDIKDTERLLVAINNLFHYCRRKNYEPLSKVLAELNNKYEYDYLPRSLPEGNFPKRDQLSSILTSFKQDDMEGVITKILELNKTVMRERNGAPWVEIEKDNTLRVKVKSEVATLREHIDIVTNSSRDQKWDYDYFLGSFFHMANIQLRNA